jgi:class 3 adenylate cyclase
MDVAAWLSGLGLEQYAPAFRDNDIDDAVLPRLTAEDLRELGVASVGHRCRLLEAIAALRAPVFAAETSGLPAETPAIPAAMGDAERRQVTVMFCDLVGSTALSARLDLEDLREIIGSYHHCVTTVIEQYDGFVAKYMGDGVLIYFGYLHGYESDAVEACAARAKEFAEQLPDWPGTFAAQKLVWNSCMMRQPVRRAVALALDLMSLAERDGDPAQIAIACRALGPSLLEYGKPAEADPVLARGVALADSVADTEFAIYGEDPRIICRLFRGWARCLLGYPDMGLRLVGEGLARAHASNNPHAIARALAFLAQIHIFLRDAAGAERAGAEATDIARQHRFAQWLAWAQEQRGWALCQLGDADQGVALLEEARHHFQEVGESPITRALYYLAEGCFLAGRLEAALNHVETAHQHAEANGGHHLRAEIHRLHAEVLQARGAPTPEIEGHLRAALEISRSQGARLWELRAVTSLARLWHDEGKRHDALELLEPVYGSFTEGFDTPDLQEAKSLLNQLA